MHDGVPTRYIPSLDGGLYRYDGESIEAVPMTAETLLSSSFKMADDTVMIGGKDLLTYGINPQTGQVLTSAVWREKQMLCHVKFQACERLDV